MAKAFENPAFIDGSIVSCWNPFFFQDITVSNNTLFIGDVPIHASNGGIDSISKFCPSE